VGRVAGEGEQQGRCENQFEEDLHRPLSRSRNGCSRRLRPPKPTLAGPSTYVQGMIRKNSSVIKRHYIAGPARGQSMLFGAPRMRPPTARHAMGALKHKRRRENGRRRVRPG
jgi:hypothetical protein